MIVTPVYSYENIALVLDEKERTPCIQLQECTAVITPESVLVRNLFSLQGTLPDDTKLYCLDDPLKLRRHPGYVSVGRIEATGSACVHFSAGDLVLMPVLYSKYCVLQPEQIRALSQKLLKKLPAAIDPVQALFAPVLSLALYLVRQMTDTRRGPVILLGGGLLGAVLLRVLWSGDIQPIIYLSEDERPTDWWLENGAREVFCDEAQIPAYLPGEVRTIFTLEHSAQAERVRSMLMGVQSKHVPALSVHSPSYGVNGSRPWLLHDALGEAIELLCRGEQNFSDLIGQHIHAEALVQAYASICSGEYLGQALVYDW